MIANSCDAVILASGTGKRFTGKVPKQYIKIFRERLVNISIKSLSNLKQVRRIYVVVNKKHRSFYKFIDKKAHVLYGGQTRAKSVYNSLLCIAKKEERPRNILIHDAARPCIDEKTLSLLLTKKNLATDGIALGYPLTNSLKLLDKNNKIIKNIKKDNLWVSYTPQLFNYDKLFLVYTKIIKNKILVDDDIEAMSYYYKNIKLLHSSSRNIKLTFKDDLEVIKDLLR